MRWHEKEILMNRRELLAKAGAAGVLVAGTGAALANRVPAAIAS